MTDIKHLESNVIQDYYILIILYNNIICFKITPDRLIVGTQQLLYPSVQIVFHTTWGGLGHSAPLYASSLAPLLIFP